MGAMCPGSCWESHLLPFKEVLERHLVWLYAPFMTAGVPSHFGALAQDLQVGVYILLHSHICAIAR